MSIAFIGGTGIYDLGVGASELVLTPYGEAGIIRTVIDGHDTVFLARHGAEHSLPPHRINYRANIWALSLLGISEVVAIHSVGSLNPAMAPGDFVLLSQFIDWTHGRSSTFFDKIGSPVVHVDVTQPYCPAVTAHLRHAGEFLAERLHVSGVYACTEGPRFETPAEIRALRLLGADVVGMTNVPEVVLAREAGLCYAALCIVCNWGAGMTDTLLSHQEVKTIMAEQTVHVKQLIANYLDLEREGCCDCEAFGFQDLLPSL